VAKSKLIVADPGTGKSTMYELTDDQFRVFRGLKIGNDVDGSAVAIEGKIRITGGSDSAGFPMRSDVRGGVKKHVLLTKGVGLRDKGQGLKRRKMVRGNTITDDIYQINSVLISKPPEKKATSKKEAAKGTATQKTEGALQASPEEKVDVAAPKEATTKDTSKPDKKSEEPTDKTE
jgi:small subunit ribosomal protein S6e